MKKSHNIPWELYVQQKRAMKHDIANKLYDIWDWEKLHSRN